MQKIVKMSGGDIVLNMDSSYEFSIHIQNNLLHYYFFYFAIFVIIYHLQNNGFIYFDKNVGVLCHSFLRIDFNRMKINFSFFRIFSSCTQWLVRMFDISIEIKWMCEKNLKSLFLENFLSSFGLTSTSDKSAQSLTKSKILESIYWSKSRFQSMSFIFVISFMFLFFFIFTIFFQRLTWQIITILWNLFWKNPGKVLKKLVL